MNVKVRGYRLRLNRLRPIATKPRRVQQPEGTPERIELGSGRRSLMKDRNRFAHPPLKPKQPFLLIAPIKMPLKPRR
jgi:hypothetical protein